MRLFFHLVWIILAVIGVIFALLNSHLVPINYFTGEKTVYFPLLILILLFIGVLLGVIAMLPLIIKLKMRIRHLKNNPEIMS